MQDCNVNQTEIKEIVYVDDDWFIQLGEILNPCPIKEILNLMEKTFLDRKGV